MKIDVIPVPIDVVMPWIMKWHYARRACPIQYSFGAYIGLELVGIVTYGVPMSSPLRDGVCGHENASYVLELNRLCCLNKKNIASQLISKSLKMLPKPSIVVSYADTGQGHVGYVYQAANFIYTGLSAKRTDWKLKGHEELHGGTIADMSRGKENRAEYMRETYGEDFYLEERSRKHRYVYFCGSRSMKRKLADSLKYSVCDYPKGESRKYEIKGKVESQMRLVA